MALDVIVDEAEVGGVGYDIVLPDGLDGLDQGVVNLDLVLIEEVIGLHHDVEQVVLPTLLESGKLGDFTYALVYQVLDLAVDVDVELQLVVDEDDQHFQHVSAV